MYARQCQVLKGVVLQCMYSKVRCTCMHYTDRFCKVCVPLGIWLTHSPNFRRSSVTRGLFGVGGYCSMCTCCMHKGISLWRTCTCRTRLNHRQTFTDSCERGINLLTDISGIHRESELQRNLAGVRWLDNNFVEIECLIWHLCEVSS